MTIPKRGRRRITIENQIYFWTARSEFVLDGANGFIRARLVVEPAEGGGRLRATFDSRALFPSSGRAKYADYPAITPAVVRVATLHARENGWLETEKDFAIENAAVLFEDLLRRRARPATIKIQSIEQPFVPR